MMLIYFLIIIATAFLIILILPDFGYATDAEPKQADIIYPPFTQDEIIDLASAADFSF
jgi:hypothetical protein